MSELSHDAAEEGFHEIQLSGKQIVFLFMAITVVSAVIFLTGVLVGRGVRSERAESTPPDAAMAAASPAPQPVADAGPQAAEPPAPAAETPDELSYHKRLQGETSPPEQLKPDATPPAAAPPPPAPPPQPPATQPAATRDPASASGAPAPGGWIVQVTGLREQGAAQKVARDLSAKGFPAFIVSPEPGMPVLYRVQVGGYPTRAEAERIARRIEQEENFKPFVRQAR